MKQWNSSILICAVAVAVTGGAVSPAAAKVPFFNATCPGGLDVHADDGGPVYVQGREASIKRFNDAYFEARDAQSGVTLSVTTDADGRAQVSYTGRGGANGICQVADNPAASRADAPREDRHEQHDSEHHDSHGLLPSEVTCESTGGQQTSCDMDTRGDVRVVRQLSRSPCEEGRSWGLSPHSVWVSDGCRAVFRNESHGTRPVPSGDTLLGACNQRQGQQGSLVTQVPVGTTSNELIVDYPDGRFLCFVTNEGMVQSLTELRKRR